MLGQRGQQAHVRAHGLEVLVFAGDVAGELAQHGVRRGRFVAAPVQGGPEAAGGQQAAGGGLHVALEAGDLAGEPKVLVALEAQALVQQPGAVQKGVAVHHAVAGEFSVRKARYHGKDPLLLAELEVGLKAHDVVQRARLVLPPQLDVGPGAVAGGGVHKALRAQRPEAHGVRAAACHHLDGHAALVDGEVAVELVELGPLGGHQSGVEGLVLFFIEGAVEVVRLAPAVAAGGEDAAHVQALGGDDGGRRVVEGELVAPGDFGDGRGQRPVGEGAGGHQGGQALVQLGDLFAHHGDVGLTLDQLRHPGAEGVPVHGQGPARRHPDLPGHRQDVAAQQVHLGLEQAGGGVRPVGLQAVGADKLGKILAFVGGAFAGGLLLEELHLNALFRQPQGGLAPGEARAQHSDLAQLVTWVSNPQPAFAQ